MSALVVGKQPCSARMPETSAELGSGNKWASGTPTWLLCRDSVGLFGAFFRTEKGALEANVVPAFRSPAKALRSEESWLLTGQTIRDDLS